MLFQIKYHVAILIHVPTLRFWYLLRLLHRGGSNENHNEYFGKLTFVYLTYFLASSRKTASSVDSIVRFPFSASFRIEGFYCYSENRVSLKPALLVIM